MATPIPQESRSTPSLPLPQPAFETAPVKPMNLVYAHAMFGGVLGILFAVAITAPVRPKNEAAVQDRPVSQPSSLARPADVARAPEVRDLGAFNFSQIGLKGHLTTTWSDKLGYQLEIGPDDPGESQAFAAAVSQPQRPLSVQVELKSSAGQVLCDQQVAVKYNPLDTMKSGAEFDQAEAQEMERERAGDVFENNVGKDGKIESLSSRGTMPCTKAQFDSAATWGFAAQFPDLHELAAQLKPHSVQEVAVKTPAPRVHPATKTTASHPITAAVKLPARPATEAVKAPAQEIAESPAQPVSEVPSPVAQTAVVHTPAPFHYLIEGDDEIVDVDATQKSIQTSAGKTFLVEEALSADNGDGVLDQLANIHYRCDQSSSCTLSLADATVLHATLRTHHPSAAQTELSLTTAPSSPVASGLPGMGL